MTDLSKYSWITSALILVLGFLCVRFGLVDYGFTFFLLFPLAVGFSIGTHNRSKHGPYALLLGVLSFMGFLLAGALEGLICVLMALPLFLLMVFIGYQVQKRLIRREPQQSQKMMITVAPLLLLLLISPIEEVLVPAPEVVTITSSVMLDYSADQVFDEVKEMDKLDADKPIGLLLGLPSPYRCELEADTVGAKRICLFKNGKIVAEITRYEKGKVLEMNVVDYTLTGRDWFEFVDATYTFEEQDGRTRITRTSSYKSILNPRIYWEPIESWGIAQEHKFVLASLKKNLVERYGE